MRETLSYAIVAVIEKGGEEDGTETRDKHATILKISNACVVLAPIGGCPSSMQQGEGGVTAG